MWLATLDTRSFSFVAFGKSKKSALFAMARGWEKHCEEYNVAPYGPLYRDHKHLWDDVNLIEGVSGDVFRDYDLVLREADVQPVQQIAKRNRRRVDEVRRN